MPILMSVEHVKWFRDHADLHRWIEEEEILESEFERTERSHRCMMNAWSILAKHHSDRPGAAAYAFKKKIMYERFAEDCRSWYEKAMQVKASYGSAGLGADKGCEGEV
jgi:hypothetical protein